jgi:hypothetical protein
MNHCLRNSEVRGSDALVEAYQTLGINRTHFRKHLLNNLQKFLKQEIPTFLRSRSPVIKHAAIFFGPQSCVYSSPSFCSKYSYCEVVPHTIIPTTHFHNAPHFQKRDSGNRVIVGINITSVVLVEMRHYLILKNVMYV